MGQARLKRLVFDTNVVVSALLFQNGTLAWLRDEWRSGRMVPLASRDSIAELVRVFSYPKFKLSLLERDELLSEYLPYARIVDVLARGSWPRCEDERDQLFIDLAFAGEADCLVTGDHHLLAMSDQLPFAVLTPGHLRESPGLD